MNQTDQINQTEEEPTLFDYWEVIYRRRKPIIAFCTVVVLVTLGVSLMLPKIYESTATLLPQLESNTGLGLGALLASGAAGSAAQSLRHAGHAHRPFYRHAQIEDYGRQGDRQVQFDGAL